MTNLETLLQNLETKRRRAVDEYQEVREMADLEPKVLIKAKHALQLIEIIKIQKEALAFYSEEKMDGPNTAKKAETAVEEIARKK